MLDLQLQLGMALGWQSVSSSAIDDVHVPTVVRQRSLPGSR